MVINESNIDKNIHISSLTLETLRGQLARFFELEPEWIRARQPGWNEEQFCRELPFKWELSFTAEINGVIVGYIIGSQDKNNKKKSRVNKIVIDRNYHRQGISRKLLHQYLNASIKHGMNKSELTAISDYPPANNLYTSLGYKHTSVTTGTDGVNRNIYIKTIF